MSCRFKSDLWPLFYILRTNGKGFVMNTLERVTRFAHIAHAGQVRKYDQGPYIQHPLAVAELVGTCAENFTQDMIHAAILHDTVEDTEVTLADVDIFFGTKVRELVYWLTDISTPEHGNRAKRKEMDRIHIRNGPPEAQTIKLADLIDNSKSIEEYDPGFAKVYMAEKKLLVADLKHGDKLLWGMANDIVESYYARS